MIYIEDGEDLQARLSEAKDKLVVLDFTSTWCGPCKEIHPKLENFAEKYKNVEFLKLDVDELEDVATKYSINSLPTFIFIKNGKTVEQFSGANAEKLLETIKKHQ